MMISIMILKIIMEIYLSKSNTKKVGDFKEGREKSLPSLYLFYTLNHDTLLAEGVKCLQNLKNI